MSTLIPPKPEAGQRPNSEWAALQAALFRYCLTLTGSRPDAEDLAQDAWVKALTTLQGPGHRNVEAFLLRIAKNAWVDNLRRRALESRLLSLECPEATASVNDHFEIERIMSALAKHLPPVQRTVFLLRDVFGFTAAQVAERIRTTEGAVKAALHRARAALSTVQEELTRESTPEPADEGLRIYLRTLAAAYQNDDVAALVLLAQQDVLPPNTAIALAHSVNGKQRSRSQTRSHSAHTIQAASIAA